MPERILILAFMLLFIATGTFAQNKSVVISGIIKDKADKTALSYSNILVKTEKDSAFVTGTVSDEEGRFILPGIAPNNYILEISLVGYASYKEKLYVGSLSPFLDLATIELISAQTTLNEVVISAKQDEIGGHLDKKVYNVEDNISQGGGSVLQSMSNLPGVTVQEGKVQLRGNDRVTVLIDGKQTAMTGFGNQSGLDNIPASAIEKIEIINNPSSKFDANGNAGIINIIMKKNKQEGFNGKLGLSSGLGALWIKKNNLPDVRPQYQNTPKINPSISLNYRKNRLNVFLQADNLYTQTLNKNEFVKRKYDDGTSIYQQLKRNRNTNFFTSKAGLDWSINDKNTLTVSALFGSEKILDRGDQPFFSGSTDERIRLWQFLEDELKTTIMGTANYQHKFKQAGHILNLGFNYTFHREDEKYYFDNILPSYSGRDAFKLLSDEKVFDFTADYIKPLKFGRIESGIKVRKRDIPTNMQFFPGLNSPLDTNAGGWANYKEIIPAIYSNYVFENKKYEAEIGLRYEYVKLNYEVNPNHNTYKSNGYNYSQPFPTVRLAYKFNDNNKLSLFYNRRVDRPNEVDIRIFPKYDDAEIIKVGNPALKPQFTNTLEVGFKKSWSTGYVYSAAYHRMSDGTITRISSIVPGSTLIYAVFQNAGKSYNSGLEIVMSQEVTKWYSFNLNLNGYHNQINAYSVVNMYPIENLFSSAKQEIISGTIKLNNNFRLANKFEGQITAIYLAPDIIPQGRIEQRFSVDLGFKKQIQKGKGELFINATDIFNTMIIKKQIQGVGFSYTSNDYYETQVIRIGYNYKF
jgi:outer membrane receptor protein involved in Fe transport